MMDKFLFLIVGSEPLISRLPHGMVWLMWRNLQVVDYCTLTLHFTKLHAILWLNTPFDPWDHLNVFEDELTAKSSYQQERNI